MNTLGRFARKQVASSIFSQTITGGSRQARLSRSFASPGPFQPLRQPPLRSLRSRRPYSTDPHPPKYNPTPHLQSPPPSLSLSQRLRKLSREYGWSAFGVYLLLSALDFPFCFAAVRVLGVERIGRAEKVVVGYVEAMIPEGVKESWRGVKDRFKGAKEDVAREMPQVEQYGIVGKRTEEAGVGQVGAGFDHGVLEAELENESERASLWTQLALAYAIHKSFIFVRVPLTVAVTPKVVKTLRGWGWDIGKRKAKAKVSSK